MKTKGLRLHGKNDLRLDEFDLPKLKEDEILARVVTDSICMSTYKTVLQGSEHKRVPSDIAENPVMMGHEFCGELIKVGAKWQGKYEVGSKFTIQTALNQKHDPFAAPGFSYRYIGGTSTYVIIPNEVMELDCLLRFDGEAYFHGSMSEPMSCIIGAFHASYHTRQGEYVHDMGIREGGAMAIIGGTGPMGLGAIDYALHCGRRPKLLVVTDIDESRLRRAQAIYTPEDAREDGIELVYLNTHGDSKQEMMALTNGDGYDDVMVFAQVKQAVELSDSVLGKDGCLNFFAGPTDTAFAADMNFYNVHYSATHVVGTTGGNKDDMKEALVLMRDGAINPTAMITHVGGLDCAVETTRNLANIAGGKKLIYTQKSMPLTAIADFEKLGKVDPFFAELAIITRSNNGMWSAQAEKYIIENAKEI
ncbi:MAG: zinc-binding dehydrogenase [Clostridia bacterium]|jgi:L-sorbose 1-phosphate reductase|nr:zinc-binding dehydrogenase [Clostridia bacterium]MBT7122327.1 zinc-binding dehydrogenase [Clostridia bacterium]